MTDETIEKLQALLPENLVLSAFDLVDREKGSSVVRAYGDPAILMCNIVIQYVTPWGSEFYQVLGSTATYSVYIDMIIAPIPYYCTCPAFAHAVLLSETHVLASRKTTFVFLLIQDAFCQCKHVLATYMARQLSQCLNRSVGPDEFQQVVGHQFGLDQDVDGL